MPPVVPGQAPTDPPTGQAPTPVPDPTPTPPAPGEPQTFTPEYVAGLRKEAAAHRTEANKNAAELKKLQDAALSEQERIANTAKEATEKLTSAEATLRQVRAEREVERTARKLNIVDEETALALVQGKLEFDADGKPTNVEALLKDLVKAKPFLLEAPAPGPSSGNPGNPARGAGTLTIEDVKAMSREQIAARWDEVQKVLAGNR